MNKKKIELRVGDMHSLSSPCDRNGVTHCNFVKKVTTFCRIWLSPFSYSWTETTCFCIVSVITNVTLL